MDEYPPESTEITALLDAWGAGDAAAFERIFRELYPELKRVAARARAAGAACAIVATLPAAAEHGGRPPIGTSGWLMLFAIFGTGLISSIVATRAAVASRLLDALRAE